MAHRRTKGFGSGLRALSAAAALVMAFSVAACSAGAKNEHATNPLKSSKKTSGTIDPALKRFYSQKISWSQCKADKNNKRSDNAEDFQCGKVTVPIDYSKPSGPTMSVEMARLKSSAEKPKGTLFINPGGPGASGIDFVMGAGKDLISEDVKANFDIVGFDPRGIGRSNPVSCVSDAKLDELLGASYRPTDIAAASADMRSFFDSCLKESPRIAPMMGSDNVSRDMDIMRQAVGDAKLTYLGYSYGTYLGQVYAKLFPHNTGRMVLDGVLSSAYSYTRLGYVQTVGLDKALRHWIDYCIQSDGDCPLSAKDPKAAYEELYRFVKKLDDHPLPTGDPKRPLNITYALRGIIGPLYSEYAYPNLTAALTMAMKNHDGSGLMQLSDTYSDRNADGTYANNSNEAFFVISALDYLPQDSSDIRFEKSHPLDKDAPIMGLSTVRGYDMIAQWPRQRLYKRSVVHAKGTPPILMISSLHDPATPHAMAVRAHRDMPGSRLISVDTWTHGSYGTASECVTDPVDAYLIDGIAPKKDISCKK